MISIPRKSISNDLKEATRTDTAKNKKDQRKIFSIVYPYFFHIPC